MVNSIISLSVAALFPVIAAAVFTKVEQTEGKKKISYMGWQIIYGFVFGGIAIIGTEWGIPMHGAQVNCRDAAPVVAGLFFGGPAGIIAGLIGGVERWIAVAWGVGSFTRVACSLSTVLAGIFAAFLREKMFDKKKPNMMMALFAGTVIEVFHLYMVFVTNVDNAEKAIKVIQVCTAPMITANGVSVMITAIVISVMLKNKNERTVKSKERPIFEIIQNWLLIAIVAAFLAVSGFMILFENNLATTQIDEQLNLALDEVSKDVTAASDDHQINLTKMIATELEAGNKDLLELAIKYKVSEISIIDKNGIIADSTNKEYIKFDMRSGEQSAEFMRLLKGTKTFAQEYRPISADEKTQMKYAGVATENGFVQSGYNADKFQAQLNDEVKKTLQNRHVGKKGFLIVCDKNNNAIYRSDSFPGENAFPTVKVDFAKLTLNKTDKVTVDGKSYYYIKNNSEGYGIVALCSVEDAMLEEEISIYISIFNMILIFAVLFILIYILIKKLVVNQIVSMADSLGRITNGNLDEVVDVRSNAEFASLSDDINSTVDTLKRYIEEAASRIDAELEFAKSIQLSAIPSNFPAFPNRKEFDVYGRMDTAKEVGGDFYDFYFTNDRHFDFTIADVSGKGIPAAMFMMRAKSVLRSQAERGMEIDEVFTAGNDTLCVGNDANMFVTAWQGDIDLTTGLVSFANAGHNPPLVKHAGGSFEFLKTKPNLVLGSMDGIPYRKNELQLEKGDIIYLYTDGITEATDANNELYGDERLITLLNSREFTDLKDICDSVKEDVDLFVGDAPQFDDMTMLAFTYYGNIDVI